MQKYAFYSLLVVAFIIMGATLYNVSGSFASHMYAAISLSGSPDTQDCIKTYNAIESKVETKNKRTLNRTEKTALERCGAVIARAIEAPLPMKKAGSSCPADLDNTGTVDGDDLTIVVNAWGTAAGDVTGNGTTDVDDLLKVINDWGSCDDTDPPPPPPPQVPQNGLVGWYKLDGNFNDSSSEDNDGSCSGNACPAVSSDAQSGESYHFDGVDDMITVPDDSSLDITTSGSIAAWIKLDNLDDWNGVVAKGANNQDQLHNYSLEITKSDDKPICVLGDGTTSTNIKGGTTIQANTPYHIACVWDNGTLKVYVNGQQDGSKSYSFTPAANSYPVSIGNYGGGIVDYLDGKIDNVLIYNRALTVSEISQIAGSSGPTGPVCGNGQLETGEQCDGSNVGGATCQSQGFSGGTISCTSSCTFNTNQCTTITTQCGDGLDNDNDGASDYPSDFSCSSPTDDDETNPKSACQDGLDNDGDGLFDLNDPGCSSWQDNNEINATSGSGVVIHPGVGWSGPTTAPPGSGPEVIATWSSVPYQVFNGEITAGVIAFHKNGIDRVEFAVNGGPWVPVTEMTLNTETDVVEYWVKLNASEFGPNQIAEVRAVAYPEFGGKPVVVAYDFTVNGGGIVPHLKYTANFSGLVRYVTATGGSWATTTCGTSEANACATIATAAKGIEINQGGNAGGGFVYLLPGTTYKIENVQSINTQNKWLTVSAAPGVNRNQVVFKHVGGAGADQGGPLSDGLWRFKNIKVQGDPHPGPNIYAPNHQFEPLGGGFWADGIEFIGSHNGDDSGGVWETDYMDQGIFYTESEFRVMSQPFTEITLIRNVIAHDIGNDLFKHPKTVINVHSTMNGHTSCTECHADFMQFSVDEDPSQKNVIFYNVKSYDAHHDTQGFYFAGDGETDYTNVAAVNVLIERMGDSSARSQFLDANYNHVLLWHVTHDTINMYLDGGSTYTDLSVRGGAWENFLLDNTSLAPSFKDNHYEFGGVWGSGATVGNPGYINAAANNYYPSNTSVLRNRVTPLLNITDADGNTRHAPTAAGAFRWSGEQ